MLTVNALTATNHILIPVQAEYLSAKGLEQLLQTVRKVRKQINSKLTIDGIIINMVDARARVARATERAWKKMQQIMNIILHSSVGSPRVADATESSEEENTTKTNNPP